MQYGGAHVEDDPDPQRARRAPPEAEGAGRGTGDEPPDFLLAEVKEIGDRPTLAELMDRLAVEEPVEVDEPPEVTIRRLREAG